MTEPPKFGERRDGWYQYDNIWYVTRGAAMKALHITEMQFIEALKSLNILGITLTNPHNNKKFTIYHFDQLYYNIHNVARVKP